MKKYTDKYTIEWKTVETDDVSKFKSFKYAVITIYELYGIGALIFDDKPLVIEVYGAEDTDDDDAALITYDFGMEQRISTKVENNFLHNYTGDNPEGSPIKTIFATIKFDLMHAFFHFNQDPNYDAIHWALVGHLSERALAIEWDENGDLEIDLDWYRAQEGNDEKWMRTLRRYDDSKSPEEQIWPSITKFIVPTEEDKQELLNTFEYIHNLRDIDSNYMMANHLMHGYMHPNWIEVDPSVKPPVDCFKVIE